MSLTAGFLQERSPAQPVIPYTLQGFCHVTMAEHEQTLQKDLSGWTLLGEAFSGDLQAVSGMVKQLRSPRIQSWGLDPSVGWEILEKNKKIWSSGKPPVINELRPELCFQTLCQRKTKIPHGAPITPSAWSLPYFSVSRARKQ